MHKDIAIHTASVSVTGKGTLVREVDALDGLMGLAADMGGIQFRTLNKSKGKRLCQVGYWGRLFLIQYTLQSVTVSFTFSEKFNITCTTLDNFSKLLTIRDARDPSLI